MTYDDEEEQVISGASLKAETSSERGEPVRALCEKNY